MESKAAIILFLLLFALTAAGCQSADKVILPPNVTGIWKAQDNPWKIVLSPDGRVASAIIPMGEVEIKPNRTTKAEMKDGSFSTFKAGDCIVEYTAKTRELFICIEMERIDIKFLDNEIIGSSTDRFMGTVSEDGRFWMADWITVYDYGPRFPQDANDIFAKPLIFEKMK